MNEDYYPEIVLDTEHENLNQEDNNDNNYSNFKITLTELDYDKKKESVTPEPHSRRFNFNNLLPKKSLKRGKKKTLITPSPSNSNSLKKKISFATSPLSSRLSSKRFTTGALRKSVSKNSSKLAMLIKATRTFKRNMSKSDNFFPNKDGDVMKKVNVKERIDHNVKQTQKVKKYGIFHNLFFVSANRLFEISKRRKILKQDIGNLPAQVRVNHVVKRFERLYYKELDKSTNVPLWKAVYKFQKKNILTSIFLRILSDLIMILIPLFIRQYSKNLRNSSGVKILECFALLLTIPLMILIQNILKEHSSKYISSVKTNIGQALRGVLYNKLVNADYNFLMKSDPSFLSRLIFFEFESIFNFIGALPSFVSSPIAICFSATVVILNLTKLNVWLMILVTLTQIGIFLFLLNWLNYKVMKGRHRYYFVGSNIAIKIQELISSIEMVRVSNFQDHFLKNFINLRSEAEKALSQVHRSYGTIEFILILTPFIFSSVIIFLYSILSTEKIETSTTLTVISMMVAVTIPLRSYSDGLRKLRIFQVAYSCTSSFFETIKEKRADIVDDGGILTGEIKFESCQFMSDKGASVKIINDTFSKNLDQSSNQKLARKFTVIKSSSQKSARVIPASNSSSKAFNNNIQKTVLKNISFHIEKGEKICVIGREGSGKDDLFLAIISELKLISGTMKRRGKFAFLDMSNPKFLTATIRENIILGEEYKEEKFNKVLQVVGFNVDKYEGRDLTEIVEGERNIHQQDKKKILLARLLYSDADIMLINLYFDQISKDKQQPIFESIVRGFLRFKTVIYTSDVNLLVKLSDRILVFKNGKLVERGTYDNLIAQRKSHMYEVIMTDNTGSSNFFGKILEGLRIYPKEVDIHEIEKEENLRNLEIAVNRRRPTHLSKLTEGSVESLTILKKKGPVGEKMKNIVTNWMSRKLDRIRGKKLREEQETVLDNTFQSYKRMFGMSGKKRVIILWLLFFVTNIGLVSLQFWMAFWVSNKFDLSYSHYFTAYVVLFFFVSICVITRQIFFSNTMAKNLTKIYLQGIQSMIAAKKSWFNQNPSSRVVYLLTKDQMVVDYDLIRSVFVVMDSFLIIVIIFLTLNYFFIGLMLVISFPLFLIAKSIYSRYIKVSSKLLAFDTKARAEMIDIYLELFDNLTMLRNYGKGCYYNRYFFEKTNEFQMSTTSLYNYSMRWLNIRITLFSMLSIFFILGMPFVSRLIFTGVYLKQSWELTYAANVGPFIITAIINFSKFLPIMNLNILSLQRIFHYMFDLAEKSHKKKSIVEDRKNRQVAEVVSRLSKRFRGRALRKERNRYFGLNDNEEENAGYLRRTYNLNHYKCKKTHERVLKIKVVDKFVQEVKLKNLRSQLGGMNINKYQISTGPIILLQNISYSTPNTTLLRNISIKVYKSEKIAIIGESRSGRHNLVNLLLLIEKRDESDPRLKKNIRPPKRATAFNRDFNRNWQSYFEMMGENVDYCDVKLLRKNMIYLSQYPTLFSGTVRNNIDPYGEFEDSEIIRTLHFLKIFPALQSFTGFENCHEIAITLKEREGKFEVNEIDIDDFFTISAQEDFKKELKDGPKNRLDLQWLSVRRRRAKKRQSRRVSNLEIPMNKELIDLVGGELELNRIRKSILNTGVMENFEEDSLEEYFREQLDDEIPKAERAKRIDEGLQEFDIDYNAHRVLFPDEKKITELFLSMEVGQNGKNLNLTLRKIIQLSRVFLKQPKVIIMDEDCLIMPEFDPKFYIENLFKTMKNSAIISLVKNYRQLYHYTRAYILKKGEVVEEGHPLHLVDNKNSLLYKILARDDIRTVRQLEMKLEKNVRKFEEDQEATVKYIQKLMKEQLENDMNNSNKTEREKEEIRRIVRAISPRNVKNMVERMKTEVDKEEKEGNFKIRMNTIDDGLLFPVNTKNNLLKKNNTLQEGFKEKKFKNQISLASNAGIDLFLTPASMRESETGDIEKKIPVALKESSIESSLDEMLKEKEKNMAILECKTKSQMNSEIKEDDSELGGDEEIIEEEEHKGLMIRKFTQ